MTAAFRNDCQIGELLHTTRHIIHLSALLCNLSSAGGAWVSKAYAVNDQGAGEGVGAPDIKDVR
jgi:hypothetical protein